MFDHCAHFLGFMKSHEYAQWLIAVTHSIPDTLNQSHLQNQLAWNQNDNMYAMMSLHKWLDVMMLCCPTQGDKLHHLHNDAILYALTFTIPLATCSGCSCNIHCAFYQLFILEMPATFVIGCPLL